MQYLYSILFIFSIIVHN